ncbi:MAG: preprotein translocase subunit YajC [Isosphaerales bacterium]
MIALFANLPVVFAQDAGNGSFLPQFLLPLLGIPLIFYFVLLRPQQQQEQKRRSMIDALKKNDKVLTTGGMYGTVISVDSNNDKVVLRVDDEKGVKLAFTKASVARVIDTGSEKPAEST